MSKRVEAALERAGVLDRVETLLTEAKQALTKAELELSALHVSYSPAYLPFSHTMAARRDVEEALTGISDL